MRARPEEGGGRHEHINTRHSQALASAAAATSARRRTNALQVNILAYQRFSELGGAYMATQTIQIVPPTQYMISTLDISQKI